MIAVIQRVLCASVTVDENLISKIGPGLLVLVGVGKEDGQEDILFMTNKIPNLRVFEDDEGKMNRSVSEMGGEILIVSQFTLLGNCRKGRRPSFAQAAAAEKADNLYQQLVEALKKTGSKVFCGKFGAHMVISLENDGPVTLILNSSTPFRK